MVGKVLGSVAVMLLASRVAAQGQPDSDERTWSLAAEADLYLLDDVQFLMPIFTADRGWLHLEGRWNYEDLETLSTWAGWNFEVERAVQLTVTPIVGVLVGRTRGVAPGLELELSWWRFELSSQSEHVFDAQGPEGNFFYNWSELHVRLFPWLSVGLAAQRTRAYESAREVDRGFVATLERGMVAFSLYWFNPDHERGFAVVALSMDF